MTVSLAPSAVLPAMSTTVEITGVGVEPGEVARAVQLGRRLAQEWEAQFSRFRPDSQLCRLNAAGGAPVQVEDVFLNLLETARAAVFRTEGRFDPSILPALEAAGYDRSIEHVRATPSLVAGKCRPAMGPEGWAEVRINRGRNEASLPQAMRIDLGGLAKGAFVDRLASEFGSWPGGCIDAGGDLFVWGSPPEGDAWRIAIEDPRHPDVEALVADVRDSAGVGVATSGTYRRCWTVNNRTAHHLIDPRTGCSLLTGVASLTAFAPNVTSAEIAAKALLVSTTGCGSPELFDATFAVLIHDDGRIATLPGDTSHGCSNSHTRPARRPA